MAIEKRIVKTKFFRLLREVVVNEKCPPQAQLILKTKSGSVLTYSTNIVQTNVGWQARAFSWTTGAEVAAGALTADVIEFIAEFPFGAW